MVHALVCQSHQAWAVVTRKVLLTDLDQSPESILQEQTQKIPIETNLVVIMIIILAIVINAYIRKILNT